METTVIGEVNGTPARFKSKGNILEAVSTTTGSEKVTDRDGDSSWRCGGGGPGRGGPWAHPVRNLKGAGFEDGGFSDHGAEIAGTENGAVCEGLIRELRAIMHGIDARDFPGRNIDYPRRRKGVLQLQLCRRAGRGLG